MTVHGKGKRISTVDRIVELAGDRRAVWFEGWNGPKSAAFVLGMQLRTVLQFLNRGLYEYTPKANSKVSGGKK